MGSDFWLVLRWWGTLFLVGAAAFPLTKYLFGLGSGLRKPQGQTPAIQGQTPSSGWWDEGYLFSKAVGMAVVSWLVYVMGTFRLIPFTSSVIIYSLAILFVGGLALELRIRIYDLRKRNLKSYFINHKSVFLVFLEELFFLAALLFWSWIKAHEPSIRGLEKFMDYGFMKSILNSSYFPPADMWYAGLPINYYYFGHLVTAVLTKLSGLDLAYTFNLMLATLFALTLTMSFSIGYQLSTMANAKWPMLNNKKEYPIGHLAFSIWHLVSGLLTSFLVTLAGNMQTIYAFTRGYTGENVVPFWEITWGIGEFWQKLPEGLNRYWYANATRFIPFTIHEFPSYSFVVSDVHGHVLSLPFVLLAIAMLISMFGVNVVRRSRNSKLQAQNPNQIQSLKGLKVPVWKFDIVLDFGFRILDLIFYGFLVGVLLMTNALDGPIYLALFIVIYVILRATSHRGVEKPQERVLDFARTIGMVTVVAGIAGLTSLPFLSHFRSFVSGLAVNCPPTFLANSSLGPFLFEGVEKCQKSPLWMWLLLWGFFLYCGFWFIGSKLKSRSTQFTQIELLLIIFFVFSLILVIFPEFFYFKDIYPAHFRSNTMFKLGYQAFILFSIVSGYSIIKVISDKPQVTSKKIFLIFLIPQLFLVSIYPVFSVRSYFGGLRRYEGLYGLSWLAREYPGDYAAIEWLNSQNNQGGPSTALRATMTGLPVIVEADGDSYTDYARFSAFTGIPTIIGWPVHEWLWRGSYDVVAPRREEVRLVYESEDIELTNQILAKYGVSFIVVGKLERTRFTKLADWKFELLGQPVFDRGGTVIYLLPKPKGQG